MKERKTLSVINNHVKKKEKIRRQNKFSKGNSLSKTNLILVPCFRHNENFLRKVLLNQLGKLGVNIAGFHL